MYQRLEEIIENITERYQNPVRVAQNCESTTYYRVEDLRGQELEVCAEVLAERVLNVCMPNSINMIVHLSSHCELAHLLAKKLEITEDIPVAALNKLNLGNDKLLEKLKNSNTILVNDVITTGRSCLEAHSKVTMMGANVLCWATIIDRTFGPGPVSVAATTTGEPIALLE